MVCLLNLIIQLKGARPRQEKKKTPLKYRLWFLDIILYILPILQFAQLLCIQSQYTSEASSDDKHAGYYMNARLMAQHLNHNIVSLILAIHVHYQPIDGLLYTLLFSWA